MKRLSWNCRRLRTLQAVRVLKRLIHSEAPDLLFLMETKKKASDVGRMRDLKDFPHFYGVDCRGDGRAKAGGLCLLWKKEVDVRIISSSCNIINFSFPVDFDPGSVQISAVYGFPESGAK